MRGGTSASVRVKLGETTAPPPRPASSSGRATTSQREVSPSASGTTRTRTTSPLIIISSAMTVRRRSDPRHQAAGDRAGHRRAHRERGQQQPGVERREVQAVLEEDAEHEEDPGEAGEVERSDDDAAGVARHLPQQRDVQQRRAAAGDGPVLPPHERRAPAAALTGSSRSGSRAPLSRLMTGKSRQSTAPPSSAAPTRSRRGSARSGRAAGTMRAMATRPTRPIGMLTRKIQRQASSPADGRDDDAAQDGADGRGHRHREAEQPEGGAALRSSEERLDQPGGLRRQQPGGGALQQPGRDEDLDARRQPGGGAAER